MKINLKNENTGKLTQNKIGFSWTVFFFGSLAPLFKGDIKWFAIMFFSQLVLAYLTAGVGSFVLSFVFAFFYNKLRIQDLLKEGYTPADSFSEEALKTSGI